MKIFLTGATGFLGTHTARELTSRGHQLQALVRPRSQTRPLEELGVKLVRGRLPQKNSLSEALSDVDVVIHIAGAIKSLNKKNFFRTNLEGTTFLVEQSLKAPRPPRFFLHVSTVAVVNPEKTKDFCQPVNGGEALTQYGESKRQAELALETLKGKIPTCILRPPVLYGPGDHEFLPLFRSIKRGFAPMYRRGQNELSLCFGPDVAQAIAELAEKTPAGEGIYCLDDGGVHSWRGLADTIAQVVQSKPIFWNVREPLMYGAAFLNQMIAQLRRKPEVFTWDKMREIRQERWVCGHTKLKNSIGWEPKTELLDGIHQTYRYYRNRGFMQ